MTALCGGGTSSPKAGVAETIIFTTSALASLLNNKGGLWASLAAPLLGVLTYSATDLCSTDPPADPTISAAEYQAILSLGPWDTLTTALGKLADKAKILVWYEMCECDSIATPAPPTNTLTPPANITVPNYGSGAGCPRPRGRFNSPLVNANVHDNSTNITRHLFPGIPIETSVASAAIAAQDIIRIPAEWTGFTGTLRLVSGNAPGVSGYATPVNLYNSSKTPVSTISSMVVTNSSPYTTTSTVTPPTFNKANHFFLSVNSAHSSSVTVDGVVDLALDFVCSGASTPPVICPTDPAVLALLGQLLETVTLIQRQQVPFAYIHGDSHVGLVGNGEIAVQGLIGALVEITTLPVFVGVESGHPNAVFEAGWINWGNTDGFSAHETIGTEQLVSLPALAGQYTRIGYSLPSGVVATITELVRES